jgi:hypothetical protein
VQAWQVFDADALLLQSGLSQEVYPVGMRGLHGLHGCLVVLGLHLSPWLPGAARAALARRGAW